MGKYTEFRTDETRVGKLVTGRISNEDMTIKNLPSKMSVVTKNYADPIQDIIEWRKAIRSDKTNFIKLYSEYTPKVKKELTIKEKADRIKTLKEMSYKFGSVNN